MEHNWFSLEFQLPDGKDTLQTAQKCRALQGNNVAIDPSVPNGEARTRHHLSTYTDEEKRWLAITADEEQSKGTGFMIRLKRR